MLVNHPQHIHCQLNGGVTHLSYLYRQLSLICCFQMTLPPSKAVSERKFDFSPVICREQPLIHIPQLVVCCVVCSVVPSHFSLRNKLGVSFGNPDLLGFHFLRHANLTFSNSYLFYINHVSFHGILS